MANYPEVEVASIIMREGSVLIGRHTGGSWEIPGGEIMPFEEMKSAAIRWVFELSGLTTDPQNVIFVSEAIKGTGQELEMSIEKWSLIIEECLWMTPNEVSNRLWCLAARIGKVVDAVPDTRSITNDQFSINPFRRTRLRRWSEAEPR